MTYRFAITLATPSPEEAVLERAESLQAIELAKAYLESRGHEVVIDLDREDEHEYVLLVGVEKNSAHWPRFNRKLYICKDGVPTLWRCYHHQFFALSQMPTVIEEILKSDLDNLEFHSRRLAAS